jgi:methyl-accepting chemotaxis protein
MNWFYNLKLSTKLLSGFILVALIAGTVGLVGTLKIKQLDDSDTVLYEENAKPLGILTGIVNHFQRMRTNLYQAVYAENAEERKTAVEHMEARRKSVAEAVASYEKAAVSAEDKKQTETLKASLANYDQMAKKLLELTVAGKQQEAIQFIKANGAAAASRMNKIVEEIITTQVADAKKKSDDNTVLANGAVRTMIALVVAAMLLAVGLGIFISRSIMRQLGADPKEVGEVANLVAVGDLSREITLASGDSSSVMAAMKKMVDTIKALVADAGMLSQAAVDGKLATRADASKHQGDFQKIVAGVNDTLDAVINPLNVAAEYVDRISKGDIPPKITDSYNGDFNEVKNNLNQCIEAVNALVADAGMLAQAAVAGKLATRADASRHHGDFQTIVEGVNETLDAVIGPLNVAAEYVDRISKGDIPPRITDNYNGDFNEVKNNLNQCIEAVNKLVSDANMLSQAAVEGRLATRADASMHQGDFRKIVEGVNQTLDAVIGPLNVAAEYVERISKGDIPPMISDNYNGDFNEIKNNLNVLIEAMNTVTGVAEQIALGDLSVEVRMRSTQDQLMKALNEMVAQLKSLAETAEKIADGDLTVTVKPASDKDLMGNAFSTMVGNLREIVGNVGASADSIASSSRQIATGNADMAQRSEEQASSLEETAASMEELTSTVKQNADNAQQANQLAIDASDVAVKGGNVIDKVVTTMDSISASSKKIADIIGVIDGIAFQTNILALNAAVEAARAGEQGRGFAVVAGEVRNLAQRSAAAAKEIKSLISDSVDKVNDGGKLVADAGQTMQEIVTSIKRVTDIMAEISAASVEQSGGIEQVNTAITQMDEITQQNSSVVQESAAAAEALEEQAQVLVAAVNRFKLDEAHRARMGETAEHKAVSRPPASIRPDKLIRQPGKAAKANGYHKTGKASGYHKDDIGEEAQPVTARAVGHDADWNEF